MTDVVRVAAKTHKGRRVLQARAPRKVEELKPAVLLHGGKTSAVLKDVLTDLSTLRSGECVKLTRKNEGVRPFEAGGETSLEFFCRKASAGVFAVGTHSKKRPHNLTLGRLFDGHVYDLVELGVDGYRPIRAFGGAAAHAALFSKPCMVFLGDAFETEPKMRQLKNVLVDFFRGRVVKALNLQGVDRVIVVADAGNGRALFRQCVIRYKRSGTALPKIELTEAGPHMDLTVRRTRDAPPDVAREARQQAPAPKKQKNTRDDPLLGKMGRLYMPQQDVAGIALTKMKGLKRERREAAAERKAARAAGDDDDDDGGAGVAAAPATKRRRPQADEGEYDD